MPGTAAKNIEILNQLGLLEATNVEDALTELALRINGLNGRILDSGGESAYDRIPFTTSAASTSQDLVLSMFTCGKSAIHSKVRLWTGSTAAGATPTVCQLALFRRVGANWVQEAISANDTSLFSVVNSTYDVNWLVPHRKVLGERYAIGRLIVSAFAMPIFSAPASLWSTAYRDDSIRQVPRQHGVVTSQATMPTSFADASVSAGAATFHALLLP